MAQLNPTAIHVANGQLASSKTDIYTNSYGAGTKVVIPRGGISLVNTGVAGQGVNIYFKRLAGTSRRIFPMDFKLEIGTDGGAYNENIIVLEVGDKLEGEADNAAEVDYVISGYREDA